MAWQIRYDAGHDWIAIDYADQLSPSELIDSVLAGVALGRQHGTLRYQCDASRLVGGHSVFDLYALAEQLHAIGVPPGTREALIVPPQPAPAVDAAFWETVCRNRGYAVCSFLDRDAAITWLSREEASLTGT